jgi:ABC-type transport system involved in multi-copper enzyme maturation permease subunit
MGVVVSAMIGATAGAGDTEAGVLRDLVATGRPRGQLFASRAAAGVMTTLVILLAALVVATACSLLLAGSLPKPSLSYIVQRDGAVLAFGAMSTLVAVGIATFARTRGPVMAVVIAVGVIVSQLLMQISFLGDARDALPLAAFEQLAGDSTFVHFATELAAAVMAAWAAVAAAAGTWWSRRMEV